MVSAAEFIDIDAGATLLGLHPETLRRLAREGRIPAFKAGRSWRFSRAHLTEWARTQQRAALPAQVLVVDDDQAVCEVVELTLAKAGFRVEIARTGAEAIAAFARQRPDLVLLDLKLPGLSGPAVLREIRQDAPRLPVIIVTGYPDSELMQEALKHSPVMMLAKPVHPTRLLAAVEQVLGTRNAERGRRNS